MDKVHSRLEKCFTLLCFKKFIKKTAWRIDFYRNGSKFCKTEVRIVSRTFVDFALRSEINGACFSDLTIPIAVAQFEQLL